MVVIGGVLFRAPALHVQAVDRGARGFFVRELDVVAEDPDLVLPLRLGQGPLDHGAAMEVGLECLLDPLAPDGSRLLDLFS